MNSFCFSTVEETTPAVEKTEEEAAAAPATNGEDAEATPAATNGDAEKPAEAETNGTEEKEVRAAVKFGECVALDVILCELWQKVYARYFVF